MSLLDTEKYWQQVTMSTNEIFENKKLDEALVGYITALQKAEELNNNMLKCIHLKIPFIQVYIISCNNLSNTYMNLGYHDKAENLLKRVVYYLLHISSDKRLNTIEVQAELKKAVLNYFNFLDKTGRDLISKEQFLRQVKERLSEIDSDSTASIRR